MDILAPVPKTSSNPGALIQSHSKISLLSANPAPKINPSTPRRMTSRQPPSPPYPSFTDFPASFTPYLTHLLPSYPFPLMPLIPFI
jgi:hypothetical protein